MFSLSILLIVTGTIVSILNWLTLFTSLRSKRFVSSVPLIGGLFLVTGFAILPQTRRYAWVAFFGDYGTIVFAISFPRLIWDFWSTSRFNLLHSLRNLDDPHRNVTINLYRRQIAVMRVVFDPPVPCNEFGATVQSLGLVGTWLESSDGYSVTGYDSDRELLLTRRNGSFITNEMHYPEEKEFRYDDLGGIQLQDHAK